MRLVYILAFQSYIWNKMVSKRIQEFGLKPVKGDFILVDNSEEGPLIEYDEYEDIEGTEDSVCSDDTQKSKRPLVRSLQADELDGYTIKDIVLPLPGYDVTYPENMKQYYKEAIEECGLTLEMPKQKVRAYNLRGTYRKVWQEVQDFDWKIFHYNDPTDNLIRSDLEEMQGEAEPQSMEGGQFKAIVVSFTLNAASYATMVLREILKCYTSSSFQAELSNYGGSKKTLVTPSESKSDSVEINDIKPGSSLADKEKYEDFKNNLFKDDVEGSNENETNKRGLENSDEAVAINKKIKVDEKHT